MNEENLRAYGREDRGIADTLKGVKNEGSRKTLQRYVNQKIANGNELKPLGERIYTFRKLANSLGKPFLGASKEDLVNLLAHNGFNKVYYKKLIKEIYCWLGKPELVNWITSKRSKEEIQNQRPKITIKEEHAAAFLAACDNDQDRALFEVFADKAPKRPKDIENLRIKDVTVNELGVSLHFSSKTEAGDREVYLQNSRSAFMKFWENHPYKNDTNGPVFYNKNHAHYGKPLRYYGIKGRFKRILKRANIPEDIKRNFTLYTWRRSVTTWLLQDPDYTPSEVQVMGGWSSIRMLDVYGKVTDMMVNLKKQVLQAKTDPELQKKLYEQAKTDKALAKLMVKYGLIKDSETRDVLGAILCPRCKEENVSNADFCSKCWLPLSKKAMDRNRESEKKLTEFMGEKSVGELFKMMHELKLQMEELKN